MSEPQSSLEMFLDRKVPGFVVHRRHPDPPPAGVIEHGLRLRCGVTVRAWEWTDEHGRLQSRIDIVRGPI